LARPIGDHSSGFAGVPGSRAIDDPLGVPVYLLVTDCSLALYLVVRGTAVAHFPFAEIESVAEDAAAPA